MGNAQARNRWRDAKVLVIDEISMLGGDLFAKLEEVARRMRKNPLPFGGIQVIACGDFFQLPPVRDGDQPQSFCFEMPAWARVIGKSFILKQIWFVMSFDTRHDDIPPNRIPYSCLRFAQAPN
jgi:ATP-dependent DNA helicase PIF1